MYAARNSIGVHTCAYPFEQPTETTSADDDCDWLHRNDTYKMQEIGGRMRPVNIHSAAPHRGTPTDQYIGTFINYHLVQTFHVDLTLIATQCRAHHPTVRFRATPTWDSCQPN